ncbi:Clp protease N-terminal domain-containing protein [Sanguibacter sp. 25GB23B1]|uniref:Clp protease N-terminal domain-containing protein n=1 Tax=unclassified Sanguibacter TaxID=2645534 RepID=UPI0032AF2CCB
MLIYDDSFTDAMTATEREATALGAHLYGSEHVLLGLLAQGGPLTGDVTSVATTVSYEAVRDAVVNADDDAPLLRNLGLSTVATQVAETPPARRTPRKRHASELQSALNTASAKWGQLRKGGQLPRETRLSSTVLWLAVLEPAARASRILQTLDADLDEVRAAVLASAAAPGPAPSWPTEVRTGPVTRLVHLLFNRRSTSA